MSWEHSSRLLNEAAVNAEMSQWLQTFEQECLQAESLSEAENGFTYL